MKPSTETSPAAVAANRANALLSTGPKTSQGKAKSCLNAVKTGLTGRTVLLPDDDAAAYEHHVAFFFASWKPSGDDETRLVQSLADTEWRLLRIPALELGIYALGRLEFAELFPEEDEAVRKCLIDAKVFIAYQRQLNNLSIQEGRLLRQREKDIAALRELQKKRDREAPSAPKLASNLQLPAPEPWGVDLSPRGASAPLAPIASDSGVA